MSYRLICSDLLEALAKEPSESFSGCLCDPPYHLTTGKKGGSGPASVNLDSPYGRARITTGFMGQAWDGGDIAFQVETWREVYRVLKPGSFLLAFGGTRTYHRLTCAIEDAGFEIRDTVCYLYGCLSEDTEILVNGVWEQYHKAIEGDLALGYNVETDEFSWQAIERTYVYEISDTAYRIESDFTDQIVTRQHRCIVEREGAFVFQTAWEAGQQQEVRVPIMESVRDLLDALPLRQRSRVSNQDMLPSLHGVAKDSDSSHEDNASWKPEIHVSCLENVHGLQRRIPVPCVVAGKEEQDLRQIQMRESGDRWPSTADKETIDGKKENAGSVLCLQAESVEVQLPSGKDKRSDLFQKVQRGIAGPRLGETRTQGTGGSNAERTKVECRKNDWAEQSGMEGRCNLFQNAWELQGSQVCEVSSRVQGYGTERWLCDGTPSDCGESDRSLFTEDRSSSPRHARSSEQCHGNVDAVSEQPGAQTVRASRYTRTDLARITPFHYSGIVWCVKVPTGAFVARRNGKVFITGNSGFPKSHNISKALDAKAGVDREIVGRRKHPTLKDTNLLEESANAAHGENLWAREWDITAPSTEDAKAFDGYGSALKPAWEPVIVAMKALAGTYAENAITHGVAGLNIDGCRIDGTVPAFDYFETGSKRGFDGGIMGGARTGETRNGRWPSNVILSHTPDCRQIGTKSITPQEGHRPNPVGVQSDGQMKFNEKPVGYQKTSYTGPDGTETVEAWECSPDCPVRLLDEQSGERTSGAWNGNRNTPKTKNVFGDYESRQERGTNGDSGGASRFFKQVKTDAEASRFWYTSKVSTSDCPYNTHPCRKPVDLTTYLAKLILPPAGKEPRRCLVPFAGSGSEMLGANAAGWDEIVGIEKEAAYVDIARRRFYDECPMFAEVEVVGLDTVSK